MPVYNGNSKAKDLYYGGTKIKEAYYGSTKVYSSALYYCYRVWVSNAYFYLYFKNKITTTGTTTGYCTNKYSMAQASSSANLVDSWQMTVNSISENYINMSLSTGKTYNWTRYEQGDLYT